MSQPLLVSVDLARKAVEAVLPAIQYAIEHRLAARTAHIVVGNPAFARRDGLTVETWSAEGGILYELPIGQPEESNRLSLPRLARIKTYMAWRDRMATREMLSYRPDLIRIGDICHGGGVVEQDWAVGISGFQADLDEAYGRMILAMGWALLHRESAIIAPKAHFYRRSN